MTPLRPLPDDRSARGVASERYPLNAVCAHPECKEPAESAHHCFARKQIGNDSWFVEITVPSDETPSKELQGLLFKQLSGDKTMSTIIPHVVGLCGSGTTGHHGDVEEHRAWIKLEEGVFVWYDRVDGEIDRATEWIPLGPLNPQPGSREGKAKRKRFQGEAKRKRKTISIRVPDDAEEGGAGLLDEAVQLLEEAMGYADARPVYYTIMDGLNIALLEVSDPSRGAQGKQPNGGNE